MPTTYEPIATTTVNSSGVQTITFSSIPSTYTDLIVVLQAKTASLADLQLRFNQDTGSNYSTTVLTGTGSAAVSNRYSNQTFMWLDTYGAPRVTEFNVAIHHIMNYANSTTYKTVIGRTGVTSNGTEAIVGLWRSTSAITRIDFQSYGVYDFSNGTTFTLYGIKAA